MFICLLAFPTSTVAEGAWTVWHRSVSLTFRSEPDLLIRIRAFTTREACSKMAEHLDSLYGGVGQNANGSRFQTYIWCLSEAEDPRGWDPRGPKK